MRVAENWADQGGECAELLRARDWSGTSLGPLASWPSELKMLVGIIMAAQQPMYVVWGPDQIVIYNDANARLYGRKHPRAFGRPFSEVLSGAMWTEMEPYLTAAYNGVATSRTKAGFTLHRNGHAEEAFVSFSFTPVRAADGTVKGMFCSCHEMTTDVVKQRAHDEERKQLRAIFETSLGALAMIRGPQHLFTFANAEYEQLTGHRNLLGRTVAEALPEMVEQGFIALLDEVYTSGKAYVGKAVPVTIQWTAQGDPQQRILDIVYHPLLDQKDQTEAIFVQVSDITEQHLLKRELAHRLKNQLAVVQAIVGGTLRTSKDVEQIRDVLSDRIAVLARSHEVVVSGAVESRTVDAVVRNAIEWQDDGRICIEGPDIPIAPRAALSLSLVLHELLTNALKYGALSVDEGRVSIRWAKEKTDNVQRFELVWQERGGPLVKAPAHKGMGSRLIGAGLPGSGRTQVRHIFDPGGVRCEISADLAGMHAE